jgi:microcystin-dependent protein
MKDSRVPRALVRRDFLGRIGAVLAGLAAFGRPQPAKADSILSTDPYIGDIMLVPFDFAPHGWAMCNGQFLSIATNQLLFSILGTTYGGDGVTTFRLPDLRGRSPLHWGQGNGLSARALGEVGGEVDHTLTLAELPAHSHVARGNSADGNATDPANMFPARSKASVPQWSPTADTSLAPGAISTVGGSQPHSNTQPILVLNYVIALQGLFPPQ